MMSNKELIESYETDVQFPDVSGFEHLNMLMIRSEIEKNNLHLSDEERKRVRNADQELLKNAGQFYQAIKNIADLASWRRDENAPPSHWWWYLDIIVQLPIDSSLTKKPTQPEFELSPTNA